ncbi:bacteriocin-associated integral membrane protein [Enterococcus faecalis 13-SD-W-01]|nr:bacteriocin-associated integral membrane protein [Enterococcus faecalis 13-SD-W-01]
MTNKILKRIVLLLSFLFSLSVASTIQNIERVGDFHRKTNTEDFFTEFKFPEFIVSNQQERMILELLESISKELNVNYMARISSFGVRDNEFAETGNLSFENVGGEHKFFVSEQRDTSLLKNFQVSPQLINEKNYFATNVEKYPDAKHIENGLQNNEGFFILPIQLVENLNPARFFVETKDKEMLNVFLSKLTNNYNHLFETEYELEDFQYERINPNLNLSPPLETISLMLFLIFYIFSLLLWLLENNGRIAIYRLNGFSSRKIVHTLLLKELLVLFFLNNLIASLFILHSMNYLFVLIQLLFFIFSLLLSYFVVGLLKHVSLGKQLNHQSLGKNLFYTVYFIKIVLLLFSVIQLLPLAEFAPVLISPKMGNEKLENYAVFYPNFGGNESTLMDFSSTMRGLDKEPLLTQLLEDGAIEVDTKPFFEEEIEMIHRSIYVNINYLDKYPIISITNQPIQIDKEEERQIIFIPERMMAEFAEIRAWFLNETTEDVLFYTIQNKQEIFAFDQETSYTITEPNIIHVMTLNNTPLFQRDFLTGGSFSEPLKVPLNGSPQETYNRYLPLLKEAGLEDNFPFLIPINQLRKVEQQMIYSLDIRQRIVELSITLLLVIVLISYSTLNYFRLHKQKFVIWRLNGASFFKTYKSMFLLSGLQYLVFFIYVAAYSFQVTDVLIFSFFLLVEFIVLYQTFLTIEKKNTIEFLEGK